MVGVPKDDPTPRECLSDALGTGGERLGQRGQRKPASIEPSSFFNLFSGKDGIAVGETQAINVTEHSGAIDLELLGKFTDTGSCLVGSRVRIKLCS